MVLPVTASLLVACVIINFCLVAHISKIRMRQKVELGDGGNRELNVAIRAHANFLENALLTILLFVVAELNPLNYWVLVICAVLFGLSRIGHAYGFIASNGSTHPGRMWGTLISWVVMGVLAAYLAWVVVWNLVLS